MPRLQHHARETPNSTWEEGKRKGPWSGNQRALGKGMVGVDRIALQLYDDAYDDDAHYEAMIIHM